MQKPNLKSLESNSTVIDGMEELFSVTESHATPDSSHKKTLEVSISQAAKILDISERTVWRKINKGELKSRTRGTKRLVKVPVFEPFTSTDSDCHTTLSDKPQNATAVIDLNNLLSDLQGANYRIGYLESENKRYGEQVRLLPDLEAKAARVKDQEETITQLSSELTALKATWWYRLYAFVSNKK